MQISNKQYPWYNKRYRERQTDSKRTIRFSSSRERYFEYIIHQEEWRSLSIGREDQDKLELSK